MRFTAIAGLTLIPFGLGACHMHIDHIDQIDHIDVADSLSRGSIKGSGRRVTETRSVPAFTGVEFGGSGSVLVQVGKPQKVTVEMDDNLLKSITTEVRGGVLHIGNRGSYSATQGVKVTIQVPAMDSADLTGSGSIRVEGVKGGELAVNLSGSGEIVGAGEVGTMRAEISGSGQLALDGVRAEDVAVDINGSGSAKVHATNTLKADISGSGSVDYKGSPRHVEKSISGSGQVGVLN